MIYYALKEGACSEQSSRMTAMDNSSKNAGNLIFEFTSPIATATEKRKFSLLEEKKIGKKKKKLREIDLPYLLILQNLSVSRENLKHFVISTV